MNIWPAGVGKSLAVGVGTRAEAGEMDLVLAEEGMLQLHGAVGGWLELELEGQPPATATMTDAMQG